MRVVAWRALRARIRRFVSRKDRIETKSGQYRAGLGDLTAAHDPIGGLVCRARSTASGPVSVDFGPCLGVPRPCPWGLIGHSVREDVCRLARSPSAQASTGGTATVRAVNEPQQRGPSGGVAVASLSDEKIRRVRIGLMLTTGTIATIVGLLLTLSALGGVDAWAYANASTWVTTGVGCLAAAALSRTPWLRASEVLALVMAYGGTMGVMVVGRGDDAYLIGVEAFSLIVTIPGIALRVRSERTNVLNIVGVCAAYATYVLLRVAVHDDSGIRSTNEVVTRLLVPMVAFTLQWFMIRGLKRRVLEWLADSERARAELGVAYARQVAMNEALLVKGRGH